MGRSIVKRPFSIAAIAMLVDSCEIAYRRSGKSQPLMGKSNVNRPCSIAAVAELVKSAL